MHIDLSRLSPRAKMEWLKSWNQAWENATFLVFIGDECSHVRAYLAAQRGVSL